MTDILTSPLQSEASSAVNKPLCSVCNQHYSRYTCPRCLTHTCSLLCSTAHKSANGCSGERNKVAYVPMNQYGWGTMMSDYVFLEEMGRRVGGWGREIVQGRYEMQGASVLRGRGRGRGGRGGRGHSRNTGGKTKRDVLKAQLEMRDIDMDLLPMGMERRKRNQSSWDFKNQTALLTIEFKFHPPPDLLAPTSPLQGPPFTILTPRNKINASLLSLIQSHVKERSNPKKEGACPEWVKSMVFPDPDDPESFTLPGCVMNAQLDPRAVFSSGIRSKVAYYRFDPRKPVEILLQNTHFVEFPTIEVWEDFQGMIVDARGAVTQQPMEEGGQPKRRRLNAKAGRKAINALLGEYGSDDENVKDANNGLSLLGGYSGSDEEDELSRKDTAAEYELGDEDADGETDDEVEIDPAVLVEMIRQAQGEEKWEQNLIAEDDMVDWGESEEDEEELE